ncbi:abscission/NoCut checkpoint regulator-like isoform X2 [Convolutriloba macropyga]|uniref:abscission/NoCut checkpoint regulator-like isoform X2 n=1 Tax=Convolutriloba macropyga TaxID=536237 RepID=UPI003F522D24
MSSDRCYDCNAKFKLFKKGKPCSDCAILHCDQCLLPSADGVIKFRCKQCDQKRNRKSKNTRRQEKRLNSSSNIPTNAGQTNKEIAGQSEDELLAARLARLREPVGYSSGASNCAVYTEEQIRARLNRLKYGDQVSSSNGGSVTPLEQTFQPDPVQTPDDLIAQARGELKVDTANRESTSKIDHNQHATSAETADELIARMKMQNGKKPLSSTTYSDGNENEEAEEAATKKLIEKILREDQLEREMGGAGLSAVSTVSHRTSSDFGETEFPWCVVCNADAQVRCLDQECENSLYCNRCFKEDHRDSDMRHHPTAKFNK